MERIPEHSLVLPTNGDDSDKISRYEHAPSHRRMAASGRHHLATVKNSLWTSNRKPPHRGALHLHERSRSLNPVQVQIFLSPEIFYVRAVPYYNDSGMEELEHFSEDRRWLGGVLLLQRGTDSMGFDNHKLPCVSSVDIIAHPPTHPLSEEQLQHTRAC